jgi:hypothetical protein
MSRETLGQAIFGEWVDGSGADRIEGSWISVPETEGLQQKGTPTVNN